MRNYKRFALIHVALIFITMTKSNGFAAEKTLGQYPLCEASAALLVTCPGKKEKCLLVGDNEQRKELYLFHIKDEKLSFDKQSAFDLHLRDDQELSDIEALASISDDDILAFASHSRNTSCEGKKERRQFGRITLSKATTAIVDTLFNKKATCEHLFPKQNLDASVKAVCDAINAADAKATQIDNDRKAKKMTKEEAKDQCNAVNTYNAEGAVAIHTSKGTDLWIGLRAPLLPTAPSQPEKKNLAILLHMKNMTAYSFDRVAFVDLGGRGIRDLSSDATSIYIIAGPPEDRTEPFELRRISKSALDKTEVIDSDFIRDLPSSSEGLAISGKTAYLVIDGDSDIDKKKCNESAKYEILSLP